MSWHVVHLKMNVLVHDIYERNGFFMWKVKAAAAGRKKTHSSGSRTAAADLVLCGLFAALTAVCSQIQIPLPMIPVNLALFGVHLCGALLGAKYGTLCMVVYVLLGLAGLPVFAGFMGGVGTLFGKTGGYIIGYILDALVVGLIVRRWGSSFFKCCVAMITGLAACYTFGTLWFMHITGMGLWVSLTYCVFPFLAGDAVKIALAAALTGRLKKVLG